MLSSFAPRTVFATAFCTLLALQSSVFAFMGCAMAATESPCCGCNHDDVKATEAQAQQDDAGAAIQLHTGPCCCSASPSDRHQAVTVTPPEAPSRGGAPNILALPVVYQSLAPVAMTTRVPPVTFTASGPPIRLQTCAFLI
jgi:hypothetical protein